MNVRFSNDIGAVSSDRVAFDTGTDHGSSAKQTPEILSHVMAKGVERPSLPTFEGIPVDVRVMIYKYVLIFDINSSLRSASELRNQIGRANGRLALGDLPREILLLIDMPKWLWWWYRIGLLGEWGLPVNRAPSFALLQNTAILSVSRKINQEATHIVCANNNIHYSCTRSFPGARIDLLKTLPWPVPFSDMQLYFVKTLSLDYCNSHYDHWTDAAVDDIDNCMARNINHISEGCPALKTFSLYIFSRPPLTPQFHGPLGTGRAALALRKLRTRLAWLNLVSALPDCAAAVLTQTIAPGAVWQTCSLRRSGLPSVTIAEWQRAGVDCGEFEIRAMKLDCESPMKNEKAQGHDAGPGHAEDDSDNDETS